MQFWPTERETIVSSLSAQEVAKRLQSVTQPSPRSESLFTPYQSGYTFNGTVGVDSFRLSRKITRPNNFLPFVSGTIEATSQGCLLFVRYRLFAATIIFLIFWSVVTVGFAWYLTTYERLYHYALLSLAVGMANYAVAVLNFKKQLGISRRLLRQVIFDDG